MILDTSAVVAIFFQEPGYEVLIGAISRGSVVGIGAPTLVETAIVLSARLNLDARGMLARFVDENQIAVIPFTEAHYGTAVSAWRKYGKSRHVASLNFGDCLTYSVASLSGLPLLCRGDDLRQTDLTLAPID